MTSTTTASKILRHTTAFLLETTNKTDILQNLTTVRRRKTTSQNPAMKQLNLAIKTLENAINVVSSGGPVESSSSLWLAERLLLSYRPETPLSCFLLSLIYTLTNQPIKAALSLLTIFHLKPSLARTELAPTIFQELFLVHLFPVLERFNHRKSKILPPMLPSNDNNNSHVENSAYIDASLVLSSNDVLLKMSQDQAAELKELERWYEDVLDDNCRVLALFFMEVLETSVGIAGDGRNAVVAPPDVIIPEFRSREVADCNGDHDSGKKMEDLDLENPILPEAETSVEVNSFSSSKNKSSPTSYPQKVSPKLARTRKSETLTASPGLTSSDCEVDSFIDDHLDHCSCSSESEPETEENSKKMASSEHRQGKNRKQKQPVMLDPSRTFSDQLMADADNAPGYGKNTPPKDFVCPITSNLFDDPVTLETGQTYERRAIQEWLDRGNSSCPITRQNLRSTRLPKTNYVLKRLIASWQDQNPGSFSSNQFEAPPTKTERSLKFTIASTVTSPTMNFTTTSPNSVISQATVDGTISELRHAITDLCMSDSLNESEKAVLRIERFWQETDMELDIINMLAKPQVINGFVEILFNSVDKQVLKVTVFLLSELSSRDRGVVQTLTRVDSDVECMIALFKKGLFEAVVLIYLLSPPAVNLSEMDMVESLLMVIKKKDEDMIKMCLKPKTAAVLLLAQILSCGESSVISSMANAIVSTKVIEAITVSLQAEWVEERIAAVGILLKCIHEDGKCRNTIADKAKLASVLESFTSANDEEQYEIVQFLSELVKLNRRRLNEHVLHAIKDEGSFSTMHTLLNYMQTALQELCPVVAGLLLQLDLLAEPRKMSIYREEAIDTLISCLKNSDFPAAQVAAAETIVSLHGRFTASGKSITRAFLLKRAGLSKSYRNLMMKEQLGSSSGETEETLDEERASEDWERKVAFTLVNHEGGSLFEALSEGLKSKYVEVGSTCFVAATWLTHMLSILPDTGTRSPARDNLLKRFVVIFKSAKDIDDKVLALLALNSFLKDPEGLRDIACNMKDIKKGLRELKKSSSLAVEVLTVLSEGNESSVELWNHRELIQVDCSENGEVLAITSFRDKIFSGHSDGTIKVWTGRGSILHLLHQIREHTKAVTSLEILQSAERLYSGSLDKTARVWSVGNEAIQCIQIHDLKDQINDLVVANSVCCFIPQGAGVKMHTWNGASKLLNPYKYVKCLYLVHGKLYSGCHDGSIQEIDLATGTLVTIQSGSRKLIGKSSPVHALSASNGLIYSASSALDGVPVKIWNSSSYGQEGSVPTTAEVRSMVLTSELIYLGTKSGTVEIWDRKKQNKIETLQVASGAKVVCMAIDSSEDVLIVGTADGRIQAWGLS